MAESSILAFGRYLRALRERRGCSLDDVASLSQTFPEKINKGYLSRCENGRQKLAFSKVIALSRIYEVPADVLVERMELDLELDRVGGPETEGMSFAELTEAGKKAFRSGYFWLAYGNLRDAVRRSRVDTVRSTFRDRDEQVAIAQMSCATPAHALGRHRFALHEFRFLESTGAFGPKFHPVILERISTGYCAVKDADAATTFADLAIEKAEEFGDNEYLGFLYSSRARVSLLHSRPDVAQTYYEKAYDLHKSSNQMIECAQALNCLAQCHFEMKRYSAARRTAEASRTLSRRLDRPRSYALSLILLGELDELDKKPATAMRRWKQAAEIAKKISDKELRFKADFVMYRRALQTGDQPIARAILRRLRRLAPWIPADNHELTVFKSLVSGDSAPSQQSVSVVQHPLAPISN